MHWTCHIMTEQPFQILFSAEADAFLFCRLELFKLGYLDLLYCIFPHKSTMADHIAVHSSEHSKMLATASSLLNQSDLNRFFQESFIDVYMCDDSWEAARIAAGGVIACAKAIMDGKLLNAFALVR